MTVPKPPIEYLGTNGQNIWVGKGIAKKAVCVHIMEGSLDGCISWFQNPNAQASANYGVGVTGRIVCFVDPDGTNAPFANGIVDNPDATVQTLLKQQNNVNPNYWTVSIEHEGHSGEVLTPPQRIASAWLTAWLCDHFGIPADEDHLLGHYEFDSVTRAGCPGWDRVGWVAWEAELAKHLAPGPTPTPTPTPYPVPDPRLAAIAAQMKTIELASAAIDHLLAGGSVVAAQHDAFMLGAPGLTDVLPD